MIIENGEIWEPVDPDKRGRHRTFSSALAAALKDLTTERCEFYDRLVDRWRETFPTLAAWPGRWSNGCVHIYVANAGLLYKIRPKLALLRRTLQAMPGAPRNLNVRLEIHIPC